jgi:hypothetical protein
MCARSLYLLGTVWKPPPVEYVSVTMLNLRGPAIQARLPRQNVPCLQLISMLWHAYAVSWELLTRPGDLAVAEGYAPHRENALPGELRMRRMGLA